MTQKELAFRSDVSIKVIRNIEQGYTNISLASVLKVLGMFSQYLVPAPIPREEEFDESEENLDFESQACEKGGRRTNKWDLKSK